MRVLCVLAFIVAAIMTWRTYTGSPRRIAASTLVRNVGVYAGAGVAYLVCLFGLRERRFWAVVLGLVIAGLNLLGVCIFFGLLSLSAYRGPPLQTQSELTITLIVSGVWIIALGQLAWHLALSIKGIGYDMEGYADADPAGFDVTPPPTKAPSSRSA